MKREILRWLAHTLWRLSCWLSVAYLRECRWRAALDRERARAIAARKAKARNLG
jgi:hypothetical protein